MALGGGEPTSAANSLYSQSVRSSGGNKMELAKSIMKAKRHREKRRVCKNYFMCMLVQRAPIII